MLMGRRLTAAKSSGKLDVERQRQQQEALSKNRSPTPSSLFQSFPCELRELRFHRLCCVRYCSDDSQSLGLYVQTLAVVARQHATKTSTHLPICCNSTWSVFESEQYELQEYSPCLHGYGRPRLAALSLHFTTSIYHNAVYMPQQ